MRNDLEDVLYVPSLSEHGHREDPLDWIVRAVNVWEAGEVLFVLGGGCHDQDHAFRVFARDLQFFRKEGDELIRERYGSVDTGCDDDRERLQSSVSLLVVLMKL